MSDILELPFDFLKRDLSLRGYSEAEIDDLMQYPVLLIPGPITSLDSDSPSQKLTNHIALFSKDLQRNDIPNEVVLRKDIPKQYIEERYAHIDLGSIVVGLATLEQLNAFANIAQIFDFMLNLLQLKFSAGRTKELMPIVKFDLNIQNGEKIASWHIEGPADTLAKMSTPKHIEAVTSIFKEPPKNE